MRNTDRIAAQAGALLDAYTTATRKIRDNAAANARSAWSSFEGWYSPPLVSALATEIAGVSVAAQQTLAGAAAQYAETMVGMLAGRPVTLPAPQTPTVRNGVDLWLAHTRPANTLKMRVATGASYEDAFAAAVRRGADMIVTDALLATRETERERYLAAGVEQYRRVIRPELSESGTCGLCVAAADRLYSTDDLLPIHPPNCKCTTMPVVDGKDPGEQITREDVRRAYQILSDGDRNALANMRVRVREHGELGPVLTRAEDAFRSGPSVALEDDPERAARMLGKTRPLLTRLEARAASGEDVIAPLAYQRDLVARLERITSQQPG